jgi:hypothetical protein
MALRKATAQAQLTEALRAVLAPGEREVASIYSITGSAPMLKTSLGALGALFTRYKWVTLTDRRFIVMSVRASGRPGEVEVAQARVDSTVTDVRRRSVWSSFKVHGPVVQQGLRLNVHRMWRAEFDRLTAAAGVSSDR